jgi:peptidoglycan/xylan/chitin deacetylase (PgdA/CDA1 family)
VRSALILGYHSIMASAAADPIGRDLVVTAARFRQHMEILARRFTVVPLDVLVARVATRSSADGMAAVTFDDGYADNYHCAFPILSQMGIPAAIFLVTENVEHGRPFWTERLAWHLCRHAGTVLPIPVELGAHADLASVEHRRHAYRELRARLEAMGDGSRREVLVDALGAGDPPHGHPLTWGQIRRMQQGGIAFGAHTRTHPSLPTLSDTVLCEEIEASRDLIAARLATQPIVFAYPFGHVDERVRRAVERAGFRGAVTVRRGPCAPKIPLLLLPRLMVADWEAADFASRLDMFGTTIERARHFALTLKARVPRRVREVYRAVRRR